MNTARRGTSTASLESLFQCLATFTLRKHFLMPNLTLLWQLCAIPIHSSAPRSRAHHLLSLSKECHINRCQSKSFIFQFLLLLIMSFRFIMLLTFHSVFDLLLTRLFKACPLLHCPLLTLITSSQYFHWYGMSFSLYCFNTFWQIEMFPITDIEVY